MHADTFVKLSLVAFGLILVSFLLLGFGRLALPYRSARLLAAPTTLLAFGLVCYLLLRSVLSVLGLRRIER